MTTIVSRGVKIVADRNGNLPSFLVSLKQRRSKTTFLYENKCRENSQGAVSEIGDAGLTRVAEFPQRVADTERDN
ncbi:hypothetical protein ACROYT_G025344 [Oculina patagonica]